MEEIKEWQAIPNFDKYEASIFGQIRNKHTKRILKAMCSGGYMSVGLMSNGISKTNMVHRLVAQTFIDNPENKPHINHIDKNRSNNNIDNLEWCTASENNIHKCITLEQKTNQNLTIWRCDVNTNDKLQMYNSIADAANVRIYGVFNNVSNPETTIVIKDFTKISYQSSFSFFCKSDIFFVIF